MKKVIFGLAGMLVFIAICAIVETVIKDQEQTKNDTENEPTQESNAGLNGAYVIR
jgi:hypothetical protein